MKKGARAGIRENINLFTRRGICVYGNESAARGGWFGRRKKGKGGYGYVRVFLRRNVYLSVQIINYV